MGRIKQYIEEKIEHNDNLNEYNVRIRTDKNKLVCITYVKAKTEESALNKIMSDYKGKNYIYDIV